MIKGMSWMQAQWMTPPNGMSFGNATYYCNTCHGFFTPNMLAEHEQFHKSYTNRTGGIVSTVSWCDPGDHPFKAGAPGSAHYTAEAIGDDGSRQAMDMDACRDHSPFRTDPKVIAKELTEAYPVPDIHDRYDNRAADERDH